MNKPIFISFASRDRKAAEQICTGIEERGLACWIATRDIGPGKNFQEEITRAIRSASAMIVVFSRHTNASREVTTEIALARGFGVNVMPVRIEEVTPSDALQYAFASHQWIDLFDGRERAVERLAAELRRDLQIEPDPSTPVKPAAPSPSAGHLGSTGQRYLIGGIGAAAAVLLLVVVVVNSMHLRSGPTAPPKDPNVVQKVTAMLKPLVARGGTVAPSLAFADEAHPPNPLTLTVLTPAFDGYVYVDYYDTAGKVFHLLPSSKDPINLRPARNTFVLGRAPMHGCWTLGGEAGERLVTLVASSTRMFDTRPASEEAKDYLPVLSRALADNAADHERSAAVLPFSITPGAVAGTAGDRCRSG